MGRKKVRERIGELRFARPMLDRMAEDYSKMLYEINVVAGDTSWDLINLRSLGDIIKDHRRRYRI